MTVQSQCNSVYFTDMRCQLRKNHKGLHEFTKFWDDGDD